MFPRWLILGIGFAIASTACASSPQWRNEVRAGERLLRRGQVEEAAPRFEAAVRSADRTGTPNEKFQALAALADVYTTYPQLGREAEGIDLWLEALELAESVYGTRHHNVGYAAYQLADAYELAGQSADAAEYFEGAVAVLEAVHGADHNDTKSASQRLQRARSQAGETVGESDLARRVRAGVEEVPTEPEDAMPQPVDAPASTSTDWRPTIDWRSTYLRWTAVDRDGVSAFVHVTPSDMPLRVAIGYPARGALDGSRQDAREAAIASMQLWETALRPHLPWFRLEFVEVDDDAPVQVEWKRRMTGSAAGRGGLRYWIRNGRLRVGGAMTLGPLWNTVSGRKWPLANLRLLVAHEFGHVLGLGHCLDCDSIMNYSWETRGRTLVTDLDVLTFRALAEIPNGLREDGEFLRGVIVESSAATPSTAE